MGPAELDNQNRAELFEMLKGKCKTRAKRDIYGMLVCLVLILVLTAWILYEQKLNETKNMIFFVLWIVVGCAGVWSVLYNYRFIKKSENLDTPEQLLSCFEKKNRNDIVCWFVSFLCVIGTNFAIIYEDMGWVMGIFMVGLLVLIMLPFYYSGSSGWNRRNREIIEELQELVEME